MNKFICCPMSALKELLFTVVLVQIFSCKVVTSLTLFSGIQRLAVVKFKPSPPTFYTQLCQKSRFRSHYNSFTTKNNVSLSFHSLVARYYVFVLLFAKAETNIIRQWENDVGEALACLTFSVREGGKQYNESSASGNDVSEVSGWRKAFFSFLE